MRHTCSKVLGFVLVLTALSSCTIAANLELYNNTTVPIIVMIGDVSTGIAASEKALISERDLYGSAVRIAAAEKTFVYRFESCRGGSLPLSHIAFVGWGPFTKRVMRGQIDENGTIWAVGIDSEFPVIMHENQPEGFPIQPQKIDTMQLGNAWERCSLSHQTRNS